MRDCMARRSSSGGQRRDAGRDVDISGIKKGLHPKMEPMRKWGKRTREEETPFAVGHKPREEGSAQIRCRETARPREEGSVGVSATG